MSGLGEGQTHASREMGGGMYLKTGDPGMGGGGTYTGTGNETTLQQYENIFGPAGRDIKLDQQRHKRHQRWHLPDALKGHNQYLTDRVDGLITDATNSPFTKNILPYVYLENPDQKLKWNVYSFDEGIASRVPYEAAARVLPQSKRSFAGYTVRQGLAIAMEHNFMASSAGRENFKNQLTQLVGSIQLTNDLDVHVALLQAPSYQKHINEKYYDNSKTTSQVCRQYIDLFGIMQKIPNALDILIEDAKTNLQTWGSQPPTFALCNTALTTQLTMLPEKTNFMTNGPDGLKRLAQGPDLASYRGLSIIPTRKFSMDAGTAPRDLLRRRVRVAEYYRIPWTPDNPNRHYEFYDQSRDSMFTLNFKQLTEMAELAGASTTDDEHLPSNNYWYVDDSFQHAALTTSTGILRVNNAVPARVQGLWDPCHVANQHGVVLQGRRFREINQGAYQVGRETVLTGVARRAVGGAELERLPACLAMPDIVAKSSNTEYVDCLNMGKVLVDNFIHDKPEIKHLAEQAETFGRGIFNDPISGVVPGARMLHNFECLTDSSPSRDFKKTYLLARFFNELGNDSNQSAWSDDKLLEGVKQGTGCRYADSRYVHLQMARDSLMQVSVENHLVYNNWKSYHFANMLMSELVTDPANAVDCGRGTIAGGVALADVGGDSILGYSTEIGGPSDPRNLRTKGKIAEYMALNGNDFMRAWDLELATMWGAPRPAGDPFMPANNAAGETDWTNTDTTLWWLLNLAHNAMTGTPAQQRLYLVFKRVYDRANLTTSLIITADEWVAFDFSNIPAEHKQDADPDQTHNGQKYQNDVIVMARHLMRKYGVGDVETAGGILCNVAMVGIMTCAAAAYLDYRRKLCSWSRHVAIRPVLPGRSNETPEEIDKLDAIIRTKCMIDVCKSATWTKVLDESGTYANNDLFGAAPKFEMAASADSAPFMFIPHVYDTVGNRYASLPMSTVPAIDHYRIFERDFKSHMLEENVAVKQAHNIAMVCSGSSAGTVTHFPNYHLARCEPLKADDAARSASSTDTATWMVQHLAAMMPLSDDACRKLMAIHTAEKVPDYNVILAAEMLTGSVPVLSLAGVNGTADIDGHETSTSGAPAGNELPSISNEYRSNLMRLLVSIISCESATEKKDNNVTYVPMYARKTLMAEFAAALKANRTYSVELDKALQGAVPERSNPDNMFVPFCGATACSELTATRGAFAVASKDKDVRESLRTSVGWKNCTLQQQMQIRPTIAQQGQYNTQHYWVADNTEQGGTLKRSVPSDVYIGDVYPWMCSNAAVGTTAEQPEGGQLHSLLSFGAGCSNKPALVPGQAQVLRGQALHEDMHSEADMAAAWCSDISNWDEFWAHVVLVLVARFYKASARFVDNGNGVPAWNAAASVYLPTGHHIMHGSQLPTRQTAHAASGLAAQDIVIIRPNIEHEMLGIIMGRGGTQELGSTFWGQTELSCYDDAQHGIWGMSYKYHERAMVTNERNLIRTYDVAFDGYNGGMDQSHVVWEDSDSRDKFRDGIYDRNQPYHGPSMMVMSFPPTQMKQAWPNPIVFHNSAPVGASIDPEKSQGGLPNLHEHMVFSNDHAAKICPPATQAKFERYMTRLEMTQWASADQSTRPAGEACIANETSSSCLAFQGSMRVLNSVGQCIDDIKGSGHLGHSYVGVASVREGRGVLNGAQAPMMGRMI